jgi:hypothetical protein
VREDSIKIDQLGTKDLTHYPRASIVNHPRIYSPPSPIATALNQVETSLDSPSLVVLAVTEGLLAGASLCA